MKKLRVLALMHPDLVPPPDAASMSPEERFPFKTEYDVCSTLQQLGHEVRAIGVQDELHPIRDAVDEFKPDVAFNLLEEFQGNVLFDQNVVSLLELLRVPYTGCNPRGLMLARDKALSKTLMAYHRLPIPEFAVFRVGRAVQRPKRLNFPLIVKSVTQESSIGISQASVVATDDQLQKRVQFVHDTIGTAAIVEQFVDGREMYVGVMGNDRLRVFPVWEMSFSKMPEDTWRIATERVKWSVKYQKKHGIDTGEAELTYGMATRVQHLAKRVFRALELTGYARVDMRLAGDGRIFVIEANPNPQLAQGEDFAESAKRAKVSYADLLERIMALGLQWQPERTA
jgi:D-alanine-D-alanine ligase